MPKVTLLHYTGKGAAGGSESEYAARLLAFTKNTRLSMTPEGLDAWLVKPWAEIIPELEYMAGTIPSSWEFVDLTFSIERLSRATAQQVTRTRNASYAMQSQRVTDMSGVTWDVPPTAQYKPGQWNAWMEENCQNYDNALQCNVSLEDARDLLPMGVHCNLIAKYNLRSLVELVQKRDSLRVQGPYVDIVSQMKAETLKCWPWAATFFEPKNAKAIRMIEEVAKKLMKNYEHPYDEEAKQLAKAIDLIKAAG